MTNRIRLLLILFNCAILTAGCSFFSEESPIPDLVSINDYTGEGYGLSGHDEEEEIGLANREEVEEAAKSYMKEFYNTDVEVQRIFGAPGAVTVIVRSTEEAVFNTYVIVPVDVENGKVEGGKAFSELSQVEMAIVSGVYYLMHQDELSAYEEFVERFAEENEMVGMDQETVETIEFTGYSSSYLGIFPVDEGFEELIADYIENPDRSSQEWQTEYPSLEFETNKIVLGTNLYQSQSGEIPDQAVYDELKKQVEEMQNLPRGEYAIAFYDNTISSLSGTNNTDNSISAFESGVIVKE